MLVVALRPRRLHEGRSPERAARHDKKGEPVYLRDVCRPAGDPECRPKFVTAAMFKKRYADVFAGRPRLAQIKTVTGLTYQWMPPPPTSSIRPIRRSGERGRPRSGNVSGARPARLFGDSITTDHISPAGSIKKESPAGSYLIGHGVGRRRFQFLRARGRQSRGDDARHLANIRLKNEMGAGHRGRRHPSNMPDGTQMSIYDAAIKYS